MTRRENEEKQASGQASDGVTGGETFDSTIEIFERARVGDGEAARALLERALPPVQRWAHGRLPPYARAGADTDDVMQDAVMGVLRRIDTFEHRTVGGLRAFLRQSVLNRIRDEIRRTGRTGVNVEMPPDLSHEGPSPLERAILNERSERYREAFNRLRPRDKQAIVWRLELGYSYAEIAERIGKRSPDAARMRFTRALARLAAEMGVESA